MNKMKAFLLGLILLTVTLFSVFVVTLIYRANTQINVETYIFQLDNIADNRLGDLENLQDMKDNVLLNKLIQKYVSEYFKVIPGNGVRPEQENTVAKMSHPDVLKQWQNGEAVNIAEMAKNKMFRSVWVNPAEIQQINNQNVFIVPYLTRTWTESNNMSTNIVQSVGRIILRVQFQKKFRQNINLRKDLEHGRDPATLFWFRVIEVQ